MSFALSTNRICAHGPEKLIERGDLSPERGTKVSLLSILERIEFWPYQVCHMAATMSVINQLSIKI